MGVLRLEPLQGLRPESLQAVADHATAAIRAAGLDDASGFAAVTVAEELCANVLEHGRAQWLELEMGSHDGRAMVSVRDNGAPFDPSEAIHGLEHNFILAERTERRLGLYIVHQLARKVSYHRESGLNRVQVEVEPDGPSPGPRRRNPNHSGS
jgi:anti-sigma regulatory factor (Ser/Thr protein kinase)